MPKGCIADPLNNPAACGQTAKGLHAVITVAVSHDGRSVYAVAQGANAIVRFKRDPKTGVLTPAGCMADATNNPEGCTSTAKGLVSPYMVALSRDGGSFYVVGTPGGTIVHFRRDTNTGGLTFKGCIAERGDNPEGCGQTAKGLADADAVAVSGDGSSVYVAGYDSDSIAIFRRNMASGALTPKGCISLAIGIPVLSHEGAVSPT
jgi:6-phosphogluconolactonase (cycloisomerase 2 family)